MIIEFDEDEMHLLIQALSTHYDAHYQAVRVDLSTAEHTRVIEMLKRLRDAQR